MTYHQESEISRNQYSGTNSEIDPHVLHQTFDLQSWRTGHSHSTDQNRAQMPAGDWQTSSQTSEPSFLPKFDVPHAFNQEQEFKGNTRDEVILGVNGMPSCGDTRYNPGYIPPGNNNHIFGGQENQIGLYLEELLREGKYDAVQTALKELSQHYAPESMAAIGKAFEMYNTSDHIQGASNIPDVVAETDGSNSLKNVKLEHFHGQQHSGNIIDQMFDQFTVFG